MVIYGEYLFIENFFTGGLLLFFTEKICNLNASIFRLTLGSILCGIYSFSIFQPLPSAWISLLEKFLFSSALIFFVFGRQKKRAFLCQLLVFYVISLCMGGIAIGIMYLSGGQAVSANASLYIEGFTFLNLVLGCCATAGAVYLFLGFLRNRFLQQTTDAGVVIGFQGREIAAKGFIDTGNFLMDPCSGKPVVLLSIRAAIPLLEAEENRILSGVKDVNQAMSLLAYRSPSTGYRLIPYSALNQRGGFLIGFVPDYIRISYNGKTERYQATVALCDREFCRNGTEGEYQILLHPSIMGRGLNFNV